MATRKKSESGAYMSQYDTEVEKRLKALEVKAHDNCDSGHQSLEEKLAYVEEKLVKVEQQLAYVKHVETYSDKVSASASDPNVGNETGRKVDILYKWWEENKDKI